MHHLSETLITDLSPLMKTGQSVLLQRASVPYSSHKWSNQHPMTGSLLDAHLINQ